MLEEIDEYGGMRKVHGLSHKRDFDQLWLGNMNAAGRRAVAAHINNILDKLVASPSTKWGSITNTSIEGSHANPHGTQGDWGGTPYEAIYIACRRNSQLAALFFGNVWKQIIIDRPETWIGYRADPTFPARGITLLGKTYFLKP